jgi:hypothetical protein
MIPLGARRALHHETARALAALTVRVGVVVITVIITNIIVIISFPRFDRCILSQIGRGARCGHTLGAHGDLVILAVIVIIIIIIIIIILLVIVSVWLVRLRLSCISSIALCRTLLSRTFALMRHLHAHNDMSNTRRSNQHPLLARSHTQRPVHPSSTHLDVRLLRERTYE